MANITLKGNSINTLGNLPKTGNKAPNFKLTTLDLSEKRLSDFKGKKIILNIFPSIDTGTCATSVLIAIDTQHRQMHIPAPVPRALVTPRVVGT